MPFILELGPLTMFAVRILRLLVKGASIFASAWLGAPACFANAPSQPADFPVKPIRIIVASSVGAADDFFARLLADDLEAAYQRRVLIENRPGAGGLIGNKRMSQAPADGYTLGMVGVTRLITELMREQPPFRALGDIVGVAHVASITNVLAVTRTLPVSTAREFVNYARNRPGEMNYASLGIGSASHLAAEVFSRALGIDAVHVPFRMATDSFVEMALGRVHYAIYTLPAALGPVREGPLARAGGDDAAAQPDAAQRARHRRSGLARSAVRQLVRHRRARRHAAPHRRTTAQRHHACAA